MSDRSSTRLILLRAVGWLGGALVGVIVTVVGVETVWSCREWFQPATGQELQYVELRVRLYLAELILGGMAAILGGVLGGRLAARVART